MITAVKKWYISIMVYFLSLKYVTLSKESHVMWCDSECATSGIVICMSRIKVYK